MKQAGSNTLVQKRRLRRRETMWAYLFLLPVLAVFLLFTVIPLISTFVLTLFKWDMLTDAKFVGFDNFARLFTDKRLQTVIGNTLVIAVSAVIAKLVLGLATAWLVSRVKNRFVVSFLESAFFFPIILPMAIVAMVWGLLLNTDMGVINGLLAMVGLPRIPWLTSPEWSLRTVIILDVWKGLGFYFIIYLVALRNVPKDLYEAAEIDGAKERHKFFRITLPMISPTTMFLMIDAVIVSLKVFDQAYILTQGGPGDASNTMALYIYQNSFGRSDMGYGAALSVLMFAFVMVVTAAQFILSKKWVHYN